MLGFNHTKNVCMSYLEHGYFSLTLSLNFGILSLKALIHALIPDLFITSSTDGLMYIQNKINQVGCRDN